MPKPFLLIKGINENLLNIDEDISLNKFSYEFHIFLYTILMFPAVDLVLKDKDKYIQKYFSQMSDVLTDKLGPQSFQFFNQIE